MTERTCNSGSHNDRTYTYFSTEGDRMSRRHADREEVEAVKKENSVKGKEKMKNSEI